MSVPIASTDASGLNASAVTSVASPPARSAAGISLPISVRVPTSNTFTPPAGVGEAMSRPSPDSASGGRRRTRRSAPRASLVVPSVAVSQTIAMVGNGPPTRGPPWVTSTRPSRLNAAEESAPPGLRVSRTKRRERRSQT